MTLLPTLGSFLLARMTLKTLTLHSYLPVLGEYLMGTASTLVIEGSLLTSLFRYLDIAASVIGTWCVSIFSIMHTDLHRKDSFLLQKHPEEIGRGCLVARGVGD